MYTSSKSVLKSRKLYIDLEFGKESDVVQFTSDVRIYNMVYRIKIIKIDTFICVGAGGWRTCCGNLFQQVHVLFTSYTRIQAFYY